MVEYLPLVLTLLVAIATVGTAAVLLRTPIRLTDLRARLAELEARVAAQDANVRKALRRSGIEAKRAAKEAGPAGQLDLPLGAPAPQENGPDLEAVQRAISMHRGGANE